MNAAILNKIFGADKTWRGPCIIVLDAEASVQTHGVDTIVGSGVKSYAPRLVSGRIQADQVCLVADASTLVIVQQQKTRGASGEERVNQALIVADIAHVVAVEFPDTKALSDLGLSLPAAK